MLRTLAIASLLLIVAAAALVAEQPATSTVTLTISGMHCSGCASGIGAMLKRAEGVVKADVSYEERRAVVEYYPARTSPPKIIEAIEKMGYKAAIRK